MNKNKMLMELKIIVGIILVLEFVIGVFFNITVLLLPEPKWSKNMKTGNNLIKNLHIFDLTICICLVPLTFAVLMNSPKVNEILCFFHESLVAFATSGLCVNILFISMERYASIASSSTFKFVQKSKIFIVFIWVVSTIGFILPWINMGVKNEHVEDIIHKEENQSLVDCEHLITSYNEYNIYEIYSIGIFAFTFIGTLFCYFQIYRVAKKRLVIKTNNNGDKKALAKQQQEKRAFKVTVSIVGCFLFCWSLFVSVSLVEMVAEPSITVNAAHLVSLTVIFLSTIIHPVLYRFIHGDIKRLIRRRGHDVSENSITKSNAVSPYVKSVAITHSGEYPTTSQISTIEKGKMEIANRNQLVIPNTSTKENKLSVSFSTDYGSTSGTTVTDLSNCSDV